MAKGRVTIKDLAYELGISVSTVSRALSNEGRIKAETRQSVIELANKWGYRPNPYAVSLQKRKSKTIGLILPDFTHHYFSMALKGINRALCAKDYHLLINTHEGDLDKEIHAVGVLKGMFVDGIITSYARSTSDFAHYLEFLEENIPVVFIDRICEDLDTSYVVTDDFSGCIDAMNFLVRKGHTKIAHVAGPKNLSTSFTRLMGYKEGLRKNHLEINENRILLSEHGNWTQRLVHLVKEGMVDALTCYTDYEAFEAIQVMLAENIDIPGQISVIGFADEPVSTFMTPKLTTVRQPAELMGLKAAEILMDHIENPSCMELRCESLPTELIVRDSTR